ncbi:MULTISPECIES: hypothetical protein [unclassified Paenibacillus]|uniref:hypothetical protein n=1 Tax=unclassified Paenibacillus TaxID=185978 RepID=UPI0007BF83CD|nr:MULTISPECIES: hypothetical protein [unclassified Paenibacillus]SEB26024.1 hypothetical protein SAMN03159332_5432 [Paenibacillus sp. 276b]
MKKIGAFLCVIFLMIVITACNKGNDMEANPYKDEVNKENEIFLFNITKQQMGRYNKDSLQWRALYEQDNLFQYVFGHTSKFVVSGHSVENEFVLFDVSDDQKKITKIFDMKNNKDAFFPLADDGQKYYYVLYENEKDTDSINRSVFTFDENNEIQILFNTNEKITSGTIVNSTLYYTVYEPGKDSYTVYSFPLNGTDKQVSVVKQGQPTRELYNFHNKLFFSNENKIFNDTRSFDKKDENFFVNNLLVQIYSDTNQDLICTVMDTENNEMLGRYKYPINFEVKNNTLYIYCEGGIYTLEIGG